MYLQEINVTAYHLFKIGETRLQNILFRYVAYILPQILQSCTFCTLQRTTYNTSILKFMLCSAHYTV